MKSGLLAAAVVLTLVRAVAAQPVATCSIPGDPEERRWMLDRGSSTAPDPNSGSAVRLRSVQHSGATARQASSAEWIVGAGAAWAIRLFQSTGDRSYALQTVSWGRELTGDLGPGALRGRFVWAAEVMPLFAQLHPTHVYGVGIAPVVWRWNFVPRPRWSAFGELAMGGMWSSAPVPEETRRANFTAHWGAGVRLHASQQRSLVVAYRLQHISNGNQLSTNPGVNSHVIFAGWSVRH